MTLQDQLIDKTETCANLALRLLDKIRREINAGDYSLAQDTCETVYHQLEAAKLASNRLADMETTLMRFEIGGLRPPRIVDDPTV